MQSLENSTLHSRETEGRKTFSITMKPVLISYALCPQGHLQNPWPRVLTKLTKQTTLQSTWFIPHNKSVILAHITVSIKEKQENRGSCQVVY